MAFAYPTTTISIAELTATGSRPTSAGGIPVSYLSAASVEPLLPDDDDGFAAPAAHADASGGLHDGWSINDLVAQVQGIYKKVKEDGATATSLRRRTAPVARHTTAGPATSTRGAALATAATTAAKGPRHHAGDPAEAASPEPTKPTATERVEAAATRGRVQEARKPWGGNTPSKRDVTPVRNSEKTAYGRVATPTPRADGATPRTEAKRASSASRRAVTPVPAAEGTPAGDRSLDMSIEAHAAPFVAKTHPAAATPRGGGTSSAAAHGVAFGRGHVAATGHRASSVGDSPAKKPPLPLAATPRGQSPAKKPSLSPSTASAAPSLATAARQRSASPSTAAAAHGAALEALTQRLEESEAERRTLADDVAALRREMAELRAQRDAAERMQHAVELESREALSQLQAQVHFAVAWIQQVDRQLAATATPPSPAPTPANDAAERRAAAMGVVAELETSRLPPAPPMALRQA